MPNEVSLVLGGSFPRCQRPGALTHSFSGSAQMEQNPKNGYNPYLQKLLVLLPLFSVAVKSFGFLLAHRKCLKVLFSQKVYFNILLFVFGYSFIA
ncbi:hypothetical protein [Synechococcus sp. SYN20]|uniref:hypothetical protein n=1 Tax=Synechococcus sp. SYN20 TaxID=1050714 RepID=UPI001646F34F|nr:hypothetical protein [Synechococcus sp. SYN20]